MKNSSLGNCFLLVENSVAFQPHPAGCFGLEAVQQHPLRLPCCHQVQVQESSSPFTCVLFSVQYVCGRAVVWIQQVLLILDLVSVPIYLLDMSCIDLIFKVASTV